MKTDKLLKMVYTAMFSAMIFVLTRFVQIPLAGSGYVHFGDAMIYIASASIGPYALIAAVIGAALADLTTGFAFYIPATIVIKLLIALPFVFVKAKSEKLLTLKTSLLTILSGVITVSGYFIFDLFINKAYAFVNITGNAVQAIGSAIIFIILSAALDSADLKKRIFRG